jgi:hypothetical protein
MKSLIAVLALAVAGCASGGYPSQGVASPAPDRSAAPLSARLELPSSAMTAGSSMRAHVIVDNRTDHAIHAAGCGSLFQVALVNTGYHPEPAWPLCLQRLTIPVGESSYPVTLSASYGACGGRVKRQNAASACLPGGHMPPLPAGRYRAEFFQSSPVIPATPAVDVRVAPRS